MTKTGLYEGERLTRDLGQPASGPATLGAPPTSGASTTRAGVTMRQWQGQVRMRVSVLIEVPECANMTLARSGAWHDKRKARKAVCLGVPGAEDLVWGSAMVEQLRSALTMTRSRTDSSVSCSSTAFGLSPSRGLPDLLLCSAPAVQSGRDHRPNPPHCARNMAAVRAWLEG